MSKELPLPCSCGPDEHKNAQQAWDAHKELLRHLYLQQNKTAAVVRSNMCHGPHHFHASIGQYHRKFKEWKFFKNDKKKEKEYWEALIVELRRQNIKINDVNVYFNDELVEPKSAAKAVNRYNTSLLSVPKSSVLSDLALKDIIMQIILKACPADIERHDEGRPGAILASTHKSPWTQFAKCLSTRMFHLVSSESFISCRVHEFTTWRILKKTDTQFAQMLRTLRGGRTDRTGNEEVVEAKESRGDEEPTEDDEPIEAEAKALRFTYGAVHQYGSNGIFFVRFEDLYRSRRTFGLNMDECYKATRERKISSSTFILLGFVYCLALDLRLEVRCACLRTLKNYDLTKLRAKNDPASKFIGETLLNVLFYGACEEWDLIMCSELLATGICVDATNDLFCFTKFIEALKEDYHDCTLYGKTTEKVIKLWMMVLEAGLDPDLCSAANLNRNMRYCQRERVPYLVGLKLRESAPMTKSLLNNFIDAPNTADLANAITLGLSIDLLRQMLEAGASATFDKIKHLWQPIVLATTKGDLERVKLLIHYGALIDVKGPYTSLTDYILPKPVIRLQNIRGSLSPLAIAAARGDVAIMSALVEGDANLNFYDSYYGFTPLHSAIIYEQEQSIQFLLKDPRINLTFIAGCFVFSSLDKTRPFYLAMLAQEYTTLGHIKDQDIASAVQNPNWGELRVVHELYDLLNGVLDYRYSLFERESAHIRLARATASDRAFLRDCIDWAKQHERYSPQTPVI